MDEAVPDQAVPDDTVEPTDTAELIDTVPDGAAEWKRATRAERVKTIA
jgi:hypothetical protein